MRGQMCRMHGAEGFGKPAVPGQGRTASSPVWYWAPSPGTGVWCRHRVLPRCCQAGGRLRTGQDDVGIAGAETRRSGAAAEQAGTELTRVDGSTDQKVGGSSPSERTTYPKVTGLRADMAKHEQVRLLPPCCQAVCGDRCSPEPDPPRNERWRARRPAVVTGVRASLVRPGWSTKVSARRTSPLTAHTTALPTRPSALHTSQQSRPRSAVVHCFGAQRRGHREQRLKSRHYKLQTSGNTLGSCEPHWVR